MKAVKGNLGLWEVLRNSSNVSRWQIHAGFFDLRRHYPFASQMLFDWGNRLFAFAGYDMDDAMLVHVDS